MKFSSSIAILLTVIPTTLLAAPARGWNWDSVKQAVKDLPNDTIEKLTNGKCDLSAAQTVPSSLPPVSQGLKLAHVAIGYGMQNYTCKTDSADEKPTPAGAIADLFNATCAYVRAPAVVADTTRMTFQDDLPLAKTAGVLFSGHHDFSDATTAQFRLNGPNGNYGVVAAKKDAAVDAPNDAPAGTVPWLKLKALSGDFKEVYRLNTAGGAAPANCQGIKGDFQRKYAAEYHFYQ